MNERSEKQSENALGKSSSSWRRSEIHDTGRHHQQAGGRKVIRLIARAPEQYRGERKQRKEEDKGKENGEEDVFSVPLNVNLQASRESYRFPEKFRFDSPRSFRAGETQPGQASGSQVEQPQQPAQTEQQHQETGEIADGDAGQNPAYTGHHSTIPEIRQSREKERYGEKNQEHCDKRSDGRRRRGRANRNAAPIKKPDLGKTSASRHGGDIDP